LTLFEAARWAPSHYNSQPWRFSYAKHGAPHFGAILSSLAPPNQLWASKAGALVVVVSQIIGDHDGKPLPTHSFDAGAAWMSIALQASSMGLFAHGMCGFDHDATAKAVQLPPVSSSRWCLLSAHSDPPTSCWKLFVVYWNCTWMSCVSTDAPK
jgi:nitroreductase